MARAAESAARMEAGQPVDAMPARSELQQPVARRNDCPDDHEQAQLEKQILRLHKRGTGILKIGKSLGIGTGTVQRVLTEQPRPLDVGASV
jgi:hypothetical protein